MNQSTTAAVQTDAPEMKLFYACFIALVITAFGFNLRAVVLQQWIQEIDLSQAQLGELTGVGLWLSAISFMLFTLIIDRIG